MKLSIILPVYNVAAFIGRALDSIYSQGMKEDDFEVICVDDCSPDNSYEVISGYLYEGHHPENLIILRHSVNKRQGGARNTGIRAARGKWILTLDADDFYLPDTLKKLLEAAEADPRLDTVMFDIYIGDGTFDNAKFNYCPRNLDTRTMTGVEFLQKMPGICQLWKYLYRRDHLLATGFTIEENTRLEDVDFVLRYTAHSKAIRFLPLVVYYWVQHPNQTTYYKGDNPKLIIEYIFLAYRIYRVAIEEKSHSPIASKVIMERARQMFRVRLTRAMWRLSFRDILATLRKYRLEPTGDHLFDFVNRHTLFTAIVLTALKPFFNIALRVVRVKRRIKK